MLTFGQIFHVVDAVMHEGKHNARAATRKETDHALSTMAFLTTGFQQVEQGLVSTIQHSSTIIDRKPQYALHIDSPDSPDGTIYYKLAKYLPQLNSSKIAFIRRIRMAAHEANERRLFKALVLNNSDSVKVTAHLQPDPDNSEAPKFWYLQDMKTQQQHHLPWLEDLMVSGQETAKRYLFNESQWEGLIKTIRAAHVSPSWIQSIVDLFNPALKKQAS